jgi:hypothetical protein
MGPWTTEEQRLLERAAAWPGCAWSELTAETIRLLTLQEGIDFATALLFDRLRRSEEHGFFIHRLEATSETPTGSWAREATVAVVPGAFYVEHPETGADGSFVLEQAARLGCRTQCVPLLSFGTPRGNARLLNEWLADQPDEPLVLVSLSKGGAEVKLALEEPEAAQTFRHVAAWINLSGLLRGAAIVNWLFRHRLRTMLVRLMLWWHGYRFDALRELQHGPAGVLDGELRLPPDLLVIHVFGFPLGAAVSRPIARRGHRRLTPFGPNDGGANLLADLLTLQGLVYPVWGADHYLRPDGDVAALIRRLFCFVGEERFNKRPAARTGEESS